MILSPSNQITASLETAETVAIAEIPDATTIILSGDMLLEVDVNGEVLSIHDAPDSAADVQEIIGYVGPRKLAIEARLAALRAEKAVYQAKIDALFDPKIKQQESALKWITGQYSHSLESYTRAVVPTLKRGRSFAAGLLKLGLRKAGGGIEVVDEKTAIQWAKLACPEAVVVKESFLKSKVPGDVKLTEATGMKRLESEDKYYCE